MGTQSRIRDFDDPNFDLRAAEGSIFGDMEDPYTPLKKLQRIAGVYEGTFGSAIGDPKYPSYAEPEQREFCIIGYAEVAAAASDPETFPNGPALEKNLGVVFGNTISVMDPPIHNRF